MDRFRRLYKWVSDLKMSKRMSPRDDQTIRAPQTSGQAGWLILHRTPTPECLYVVRSQLAVERVPYVIDERCFDDTIFRVETTKTKVYLADVFVWQGVPVHTTHTFAERQALLQGFLDTCYTPCPEFEWKALSLRSTATLPIKGYEYYSDAPGDIGAFTDDTRVLYTARRTDIPDVYSIDGEEGYLDVPDLPTSQRLLALGEVFQVYCRRQGDLWEIVAVKDK